MNVNGIAFYVVAAVALLAAVAVVALPSLRLAAYALSALGGATAVLFLILGNELLFAAQLLVYGMAVPALVLTAITLVRARAGAEAAERRPFTAWWPVALLAGLGTAALLLGVAAVSGDTWRSGTYPSDATAATTMGRLIFQTYALPFATSAVLLLAALVGAVVIGRRDDLEAELEEAERERHRREERMRRRREDRERARRAQRPAAVAEGEGQ